jgi:hypothetical protein
MGGFFTFLGMKTKLMLRDEQAQFKRDPVQED